MKKAQNQPEQNEVVEQKLLKPFFFSREEVTILAETYEDAQKKLAEQQQQTA